MPRNAYTKPTLDLDAIRALVAYTNQRTVAREFGINVETLRNYLRGQKPGSDATVVAINNRTEIMYGRIKRAPKLYPR